jgi:signal transduction histidine kinase
MDNMKSLFQFSRTGSFRLTAIAILTTGALFYGYNSYFRDYKDLVSLHDGISTCTQRVSQSFTAKMIGDKNSVYLQNDFMNLSEDCFADTIASFNANLSSKLSLVGSQINQLASESHSLHEKILLSGSTTNEIGKIYERIEAARNILVDEIDNSKIKNQSSQNMLFVSLIASFLLMSLIALKSLWDMVREFKANLVLEALSREQLSSQDTDRANKMEEIFTQIFRQNNLSFSSQMFQSFKNYWQDKAIVAINNAPSFNLQKPKNETVVISSSQQVDVIHDHVIQVKESSVETVTTISNPEARVETVNLTETLSKVINLLSGKAFSNGVALDFDLSQNISVKGSQDSISQILFNLLSHSVNNNLSNQSLKRIKASLIKTADRVTLKLIDNSQIYTDELIKEINSQMNTIEDLSLCVCKEFVNEVKGELTVKNLKNENGEVSQSITELTLNLAPSKEIDSPRLVSYMKGKKKDFKKKNRNNRYDQSRFQQSI